MSNVIQSPTFKNNLVASNDISNAFSYCTFESKISWKFISFTYSINIGLSIYFVLWVISSSLWCIEPQTLFTNNENTLDNKP